MRLYIGRALVASLFSENEAAWDTECVRDVFEPREAELILNIPLSHRRPADTWIWIHDSRGRYTVKTSYRKLVGEAHDARPWKKLWDLKVPPKVIISFCWQLVSGYLPTRDALFAKHVACSLVCHLCAWPAGQEETAAHLFADCCSTKLMWSSVNLPVIPH